MERYGLLGRGMMAVFLLYCFSSLALGEVKLGPPFFNGKILPSPQRVEYLDEYIDISEKGRALACIFVAKGKDIDNVCIEDVSNRVKDLGGDISITVDERKALSYPSIISIGPNSLTARYLKKYNLSLPNHDEGYIIYPLKDKGKNIILCTGKTDRGTYWSIQSLLQLFTRESDSVLLYKARVFDYPYVKYRTCFGGMPAYKYNLSSWITSEKGKDIDWRKVYQNPEWLEDIIKKIKKVKRRYIIPQVPISGVHVPDWQNPESKLYITISNPEDMKILIDTSCEIVKAGGIVALHFDDKGHVLTSRDKERFGTLEDAHFYCLSQIYKEVKKIDPDTILIFCPPLYFGAALGFYPTVDGPRYLKVISKLPKDILIYWTGGDVVGRYVSEELIKEWDDYYDRKLFFWDNHWQWRYLEARDFHYTHPNFYKHIEGYFVPGKGEIGMITLADYLWNPTNYQPDTSLKLAVEQYAGVNIYPVFKRWKELLTRLNELKPIPNMMSALSEYVKELKRLSEEIKRECKNQDFVSLIVKTTSAQIKRVERANKEPAPPVLPEMVILENELIKLEIIPSQGGRINRWIDKRRNRNLLFTEYGDPDAIIGDIRRGYTEFAIGPLEPHCLGEFSSTFSKKGETQRVYLTTEIKKNNVLKSNYSISKTITLEDNTVTITTELKNLGPEKELNRLRIHPEFALPFLHTLNRYYLYLQRTENRLERILMEPPPGSLSYAGKTLPKGMWGIGDEEENWGIFNYFNTEEISLCFFFADWDPRLRNLELMSKFKELKVGEALKISHKYIFVEDLRGFLKNYTIVK